MKVNFVLIFLEKAYSEDEHGYVIMMVFQWGFIVQLHEGVAGDLQKIICVAWMIQIVANSRDD